MAKKPKEMSAVESATGAVRRSLQEFREIQEALVNFTRENAEVIEAYEGLVKLRTQMEDEVKTAMRAVSAFVPEVKQMEFAPGVYYNRSVERTVNAAKLIERVPNFVKDFPGAITVKVTALDGLVSTGQVPAEVVNEVVTTVSGSVRCYIK